jgi:hypothetical protein
VAVNTGSPISVGGLFTTGPTGTGLDVVVPVGVLTGGEVTVFVVAGGLSVLPINVSVFTEVVVVSNVLMIVISVCWVVVFLNSWVEIPSVVPALPEFPTVHGPVVGVATNVLSRLVTMGGPAILVVSVDVVLTVVVVTQVITPLTFGLHTGPVVVVWANAVPAPNAAKATITAATPRTKSMRFTHSLLLLD